MNLLLSEDPGVRQFLLDALGTPASVVEKKAQGFVVSAMNALMREFYGLPAGKEPLMVEVESIMTLTGASREIAEAFCQRANATYAQCFNEGEVVTLETETRLADGSSRWSRNVSTPLFSDGEVKLVLTMLDDVTHLKLARQKLEENLAALVGQHVAICNHCRRVYDEETGWMTIEQFMSLHNDLKFSHGICESCSGEVLSDAR